MDTQNMWTKFHGLSLKNGVDMQTFVRKTCVFCVVICNYLVLVQDRVFVIYTSTAQIRAQHGRRIISASSLMFGQHTDVRKEGVLDEAGGPSTVVVFKLPTSLSANMADLIWYITFVSSTSFILYPGMHQVLLSCGGLDHTDISQKEVFLCRE